MVFVSFFFFLHLFICGCAESSCGDRGLLSRCGSRASHCRGFPCCGAQAPGGSAFSSCSSQALEQRLNSYGARAWLLLGMWDLPGSGIKPVSPALAGRFLSTVPPGKSSCRFFIDGHYQIEIIPVVHNSKKWFLFFCFVLKL